MVARWGITFMCAVVGVVGMATTAHAAPTGKTAAPRKPPMGFSSWNHFGMSGDEVIMHARACACACVCVCVRCSRSVHVRFWRVRQNNFSRSYGVNRVMVCQAVATLNSSDWTAGSIFTTDGVPARQPN
jgi:hypothetical protein